MRYDKLSDHDMIAMSSMVAEAFTPQMYAYLLSLLPTPEGFSKLQKRLKAKYQPALKGSPEMVEAFEADREAMNCDLSLIHDLAKIVAVKDPTVPESLCLVRAMGKAPAARILTNPERFKVFFDQQGQILASVTKVPAAKGYQVWACDSDPGIAANWRLVAASPTCKGIAITGLNRAKVNMLKIRGMRGKGAGPWSNLVSINPA